MTHRSQTSRAARAALLLGCVCGLGCRGEPRPGTCDEALAGTTARRVPNEGWTHVDTPDALVYQHNPPASGPHFDQWAGYQIHDAPIARGNWVHNLEHGAVVLLIGPAASDAERQLLRDAYEALPVDEDCGHRRALMTTDDALDSAVAAVAADFVLESDDGALTVDGIVAFGLACRDRAPEDICL
jgi:hypothetical protein